MWHFFYVSFATERDDLKRNWHCLWYKHIIKLQVLWNMEIYIHIYRERTVYTF